MPDSIKLGSKTVYTQTLTRQCHADWCLLECNKINPRSSRIVSQNLAVLEAAILVVNEKIHPFCK